eukprot:scaffold23862_cov38-Cyclotella_meneghiniana.AAC.1
MVDLEFEPEMAVNFTGVLVKVEEQLQTSKLHSPLRNYASSLFSYFSKSPRAMDSETLALAAK